MKRRRYSVVLAASLSALAVCASAEIPAWVGYGGPAVRAQDERRAETILKNAPNGLALSAETLEGLEVRKIKLL